MTATRPVRWKLPAAVALFAIVVGGGLVWVVISRSMGPPAAQSVKVVATGIVRSTGVGCVATDARGTLFLPNVDGSEIYLVSSAGSVEPLHPSVTWPFGVAFDPAGNLYASRTRADDGIVRLRKGSWEALDYSRRFGDGSEFGSVLCLTFDGRGNLYASSFIRNSVWRIADGQVSLFAGTGRAGYTGDRGLATHAELQAPFGLATDREGGASDGARLVAPGRDAEPASFSLRASRSMSREERDAGRDVGS